MVQGIFGELRGLPQGEKEKEKEQEPSGGKESKGLRKVIQAIASVFKVIMGLYGKVASGLNKILGKINITTKPWFASFSMGYAAAMKAVEAVKNPGNELGEGVGKVREVIGEFFGSIKGKLTEVSNGLRDKLGILGNPAQLMKTLANKAVDMVLNFIITHPPSALIKAAFKAVEAVADKPIIDLIRQHIPFADKLINKIAESGPVQGLLKPLQKPVNQLGGVIDKVSGGAVKIVDQSQQTAMGMFGSGSKLLKDMGGSKSASGEKSKGGPDFIGSVKSGIHSRLMRYGEMNLLKSGKKLAKGAVNKAKGMILGLKKFMIGSESHELWVEKRGNKNVVMMASTVEEISKKIAGFYDSAAKIEDKDKKEKIVGLISRLNESVIKLHDEKATDEVIQTEITNSIKLIKVIYPAFEVGTQAEKAISKIDEIEVKFNYKTKYDKAEFAKQLADQEAGMNKLTVDEYLKNRKRYIDEGRAIEGNAAQQAARKEALANKVDELLDSGMSFQEAEKEAEKLLASQAALHNPDQVAGGNPLNIGGMGDKGVNSSIGVQWKYRIKDVDKRIRALAGKMTEEEKKSTYLNVKLKY